MKKILFYICMFFVTNVCLSQNSHKDIFKLYNRNIDGCRCDVEEIVLYKDSTFIVYSCIGGVGIDYTGGWWINDSSLILQPSLKCDGPILLQKEEHRDKKTEEVRMEVYNENGKLIHYCIMDSSCRIKVLYENGCHLLDVKEKTIQRYIRFTLKGKGLTPIPMKKHNNVIEMIILEPTSSSDVYFGKQTIPLRLLTERSITIEKNDN